jgi:hypothetical protein
MDRHFTRRASRWARAALAMMALLPAFVMLPAALASGPAVVPAGPRSGPDLELTPNPCRFGLVPVGGHSERVLRLRNRGDQVTNVNIGLSGCGDFVILVGGGEISLPPGQEHYITVGFNPSGRGLRTAVLRADGSSCWAEALLRGWGMRQGGSGLSPQEEGQAEPEEIEPGTSYSQPAPVSLGARLPSTDSSAEAERGIPPGTFASRAIWDPSAGCVVIAYDLPRDSQVALEVCNITGRMLATQVNGWQNAGPGEIRWRTERLPNGVYFYRISAGRSASSGHVVLVH